MEMTAHLSRLFAYDTWANRETLASLEAAASPPAVAVKRMAHVLGAEGLWLARLRGENSPMAVWPELSLADCAREAGRLERVWREHLASLSEEALARRVAYVNSKGEPWESAAGDILQQVVMHSVYHRGQIASDLRAAGFEPAYTDFIHAVRKGLLEQRQRV
jgi:uncharacterized damage-inducible protein DinB